MGLMDFFRRRKGDSAQARAMVMYRTGQAAPRIVDPATLAKDGYQKNPDVFAAVTGITTTGKAIPWELMKLSKRAVRRGVTPLQVRKQLTTAAKMGGAGGEGFRTKLAELRKQQVLIPVDTHDLLDLLAMPNPRTDWSEYVEAWLGCMCVTGNAFQHAVGPDDPTRPPLELEILRPDKMGIVIGDREQPIRWYKYGTGEGEKLDPSMVDHAKTWNPTDDFWGLSPIMAAAKRVDWTNAADDWNLSLMRNGGQRAGAVVVEDQLTGPQRKDLKEWVDNEYMGMENVGRPLLLEGGMAWQDLAMTPQEAAWLEGQANATRKIANVLSWPAVLLGDSSDKTYSNYQEARKAGITDAVLPRLDTLRNRLNTWLVPRYGDDLMLVYNTDEVEVLHEERSAVWDRVGKATFLTVNEKREAVKLDPVPGGDVILTPATMLPLNATPSRDDEQRNANPSQAKAIGLQTYDQKTAWWEVVQKQRDRLEVRVQELVRDRMEAEADAVAQAVRDAGSAPAAAIAAEVAIEAQVDAWATMLTRAWLIVAEVFATQVMEQLEKSAGGLAYGVTKDAADDAWQEYVQEYLGTEAKNRSKKITDTSMEQIRDAIGAGIEEGEGVDKLADRVSTVYTEATPWRATMIARTETIAASNAGGRAGAKATGLPLKKEWVATRDGRARDTHLKAEERYEGDGAVGLDDPFMVGSSELLFPGDSSRGAEAGEVVNCRCTEVYQVDRDE